MSVGTVSNLLIEQAIKDVYDEIYQNKYTSSWWRLSEADLLFELIACILGSRVSYEVALAAVNEIKKAGLVEHPSQRYCLNDYENAVFQILSSPLHNSAWPSGRRRYPFPRSKANYISRTVRAIYSNGGSLRRELEESKTTQEARRSIICTAVGIGPKQASLFLRNIGFTDEVAILDSHVLRYMHMSGLIEKAIKTVSTLRAYEMHESTLLQYAFSTGRSLGNLDLAIWVVMRIYLKGAWR